MRTENTPDRALASTLVLLSGSEDFLRRRCLEDLLRAAGTGPDDFDYQVFDGAASQIVDWIAAVGTAPFLAERRTVVVRKLLSADIERLKNIDLSKLPPTSWLILVADEEGGGDGKGQRASAAGRAWDSAVKRAKGVTLSFDPDPKAARSAIKEELQRAGKTMSYRATESLLDMCGGNLSRSLEELDKLVLYVGGSEAITEREVQLVVVPSREWNVFRMTDAIVSNQIPEALRQLKTLVGTAARAEEAAYRQIVPMLSRSLRLLWQARVCLDAGCTPKAAPPEVAGTFLDRPNIASEQPYRLEHLMASARRTTLEGVAQALQVLSDTDARLKGNLPSMGVIDSLERMVIEMAAALARPSSLVS